MSDGMQPGFCDAGKIGIVVLAAGASTRMGKPKQLLVYQGKTLLRHTVDTALSVADGAVIVVLGAGAEVIRKEMTGLKVTGVENPEWESGLGSSLRVGLEALLARYPESEAVLFLLCDQPHLSPAILQALINAYKDKRSSVVASAYGETLGVPALFDHNLFGELLSMEGKGGAKQIIERHRKNVVAVPFAGGVVDIDTPGDYEKLIGS